MAHLTEEQRHEAALQIIHGTVDNIEFLDAQDIALEDHPDADAEDIEAIYDLVHDATVSISFD